MDKSGRVSLNFLVSAPLRLCVMSEETQRRKDWKTQNPSESAEFHQDARANITTVDAMVNWKRTRLEFTPDTYDHIRRHGVQWFEVEDVFNHKFIPRKVRVNGEVRYVVIGESSGRILAVIVAPLPGDRIRVITTYEPSDRRKRIYRDKCKR